MSTCWTRRQFLVHVGAAAAAIQTFEHLDPCCVFAADAKTADTELFELKPVADGVYAAIAAPRYKINSNAAVILTNDGVVVVDYHSKPSAAQALYKEIQGITNNQSARSSIPIFIGITGKGIRPMQPPRPIWRLSLPSVPKRI
jgi:hypothetical protein